MPTAVDSSGALPTLDAPRVPTLTLQPLYLMVGDTGRVSASAKDAQGNAIANPGLVFRSLDTSIVNQVATRSGQGWLARKTGATYVVAQFGTIVDSFQVNVRPKGALTSNASAIGPATAFERPKFATLAARRSYVPRLDSAARAIKQWMHFAHIRSEGHQVQWLEDTALQQYQRKEQRIGIRSALHAKARGPQQRIELLQRIAANFLDHFGMKAPQQLQRRQAYQQESSRA